MCSSCTHFYEPRPIDHGSQSVPAYLRQAPGAVQDTDFFAQFDTDGDGYICFGEYLLIVTFLAIPLEVC